MNNGYNNNYNPASVEFAAKCPYTIELTYEAYAKLRAYILNTQSEISGLGAILLDREKQTIYVYDIFLIDQTVGPGNTNLDSRGLAKFYAERMQANPKDDLADYKLWWHSHYNFATFWSGVDDTTIDSLDQETNEDNWLLSIVGNQAGELLCRLDIFRPIRMTFNRVPYLIDEVNTEIKTAAISEIEQKVHQAIYPVWNGKKNGKHKNKQKYLPAGSYHNRGGVWTKAEPDDDSLFPGVENGEHIPIKKNNYGGN